MVLHEDTTKSKRETYAPRGERITEGRAREGNPKERGECERSEFPFSPWGVSLAFACPACLPQANCAVSLCETCAPSEMIHSDI